MQPYQTSLVVRDERGLVASGRELELALRGTSREISSYLDEVRAARGRSAELLSADLISSEQKNRRLARLTAEGRVLNPQSPGEPGTPDEHAAVLRSMAAEISDLCTADEGSTLAVHQRFLVQFDEDLRPPAVKLTTVASIRSAFTALIDSYSPRDSWDFYLRERDLHCWGHEGLGDIPIPDWRSIRMQDISDQGIKEALAARRWPNVQEVSDLLAILGEDTQELAQAALADRLRALAPWRGSMGELARGLGWAGTLQLLVAEIEQISADLLTRGITVYRTGHRCGKNRLAEWAVERKEVPSVPSVPSLMP